MIFSFSTINPNSQQQLSALLITWLHSVYKTEATIKKLIYGRSDASFMRYAHLNQYSKTKMFYSKLILFLKTKIDNCPVYIPNNCFKFIVNASIKNPKKELRLEAYLDNNISSKKWKDWFRKDHLQAQTPEFLFDTIIFILMFWLTKKKKRMYKPSNKESKKRIL